MLPVNSRVATVLIATVALITILRVLVALGAVQGPAAKARRITTNSGTRWRWWCQRGVLILSNRATRILKPLPQFESNPQLRELAAIVSRYVCVG